MISQSKQRIVARLRKPKDRGKQRLVLVEGPRAVSELIGSGAVIRWVLVGRDFAGCDAGRLLVDLLEAGNVFFEEVDDEAVRALGGTVSPQPVLAVADQPEQDVLLPVLGRYLVVDQVRDPGNLGTMIRTAWAMGLDAVLTMKGTTDPWAAKVVRASAGGVFRIPIQTDLTQGALDRFSALKMPLYYASAGAQTVAEVRRTPSWLLVLGNEAHGVSQEVRKLGNGVSVPMVPEVDSLNVAVAGSILMYVLGGRAS